MMPDVKKYKNCFKKATTDVISIQVIHTIQLISFYHRVNFMSSDSEKSQT